MIRVCFADVGMAKVQNQISGERLHWSWNQIRLLEGPYNQFLSVVYRLFFLVANQEEIRDLVLHNLVQFVMADDVAVVLVLLNT